MNDESKSTPLEARIVGAIVGLVNIGLGVSMWVWPDIGGAAGEEPTRDRTRLLALLIEWIWSRPAGVAAVPRCRGAAWLADHLGVAAQAAASAADGGLERNQVCDIPASPTDRVPLETGRS
jgi:hypothetical protein